MAETNKPAQATEPSGHSRALLAEKTALRRARNISRKWGERLDEFDLPCPLCRGELEFQGVTQERLYEFAEGEPGVVEPLDIFTLNFVCNLCGYTAEFDAELFNPAHLAKLAGAKAEHVAALTVRDFRLVVPMRGDERSETLLDLATAIAGYRKGDVIILDTAQNETLEGMLTEKLHQYKPAAGDPAPVFVIRQGSHDIQEAWPAILKRQRCDLMLLKAKGWARLEEADVASVINEILTDAICDIALVYDRGIRKINRILLATAGGPSAKAAAPFALDLAKSFDAELHLLYVASPDDAQGEDEGQRRITETLGELEIDESVAMQRRVIFGQDPIQVIINEAANYALLLMGGSPQSWRGRLRLDTLSANIARNSAATAIVVLTRTSKSRSWLSRFLG
jgi:nucleotide-binding universal stress UspA family protein